MTAAAAAAKLPSGRNCTSLSSLHPVFPVTVARMERQRNPAAPLAARRRTTFGHWRGPLCHAAMADTEGGIRFEEKFVVLTPTDCLVYRLVRIAGRRGCPITGAADDMDQRPRPVRDPID